MYQPELEDVDPEDFGDELNDDTFGFNAGGVGTTACRVLSRGEPSSLGPCSAGDDFDFSANNGMMGGLDKPDGELPSFFGVRRSFGENSDFKCFAALTCHCLFLGRWRR